MKPTLLLASLALGFTSPIALSQTELEKLRTLAAEQDRQIKLLEEENARLRSLVTREKTRAYPTDLISNPSPAAAQPKAESTGTYTVVAGDNLVKIARKVGGSAEAIAKLNGIKMSTVIHPGQKLKVPTAATAQGPKAPAAATAQGPKAPAAATAQAAKPPAPGRTHKVQAGETFFSISRKYNMSTDALIAANPGVKPAALQVGQNLKLSAAAPATSTASTASTPKPAPPATAPAPSPAPSPAPREAPRTAAAPPEKSPDPIAQTATQEKKSVIRSITIDSEMTYGQFASTHGTSPERLNDLNGLDLTSATVLAKGSELYVPAQP